MEDNIIIIVVVVMICCCSIFSIIGGAIYLRSSKSTTDTSDTSVVSGTTTTSATTIKETPRTPDSSGNTYWDCMIDNDKKGKVSINWGHTSGDGGWACNEWNKECDKKCTAIFSSSQAPSGMDGVLDIEPRKDKCQDGWTEIDSDINQGCKGDSIKMCIKKGRADRGIKSLSISQGLGDCPNKHEYNMKSGTGSATPNLYLCREYGYPFAKEIKITDNKETGWNYAKNKAMLGGAPEPQDLEQGCGSGSPTKYLVWSN